MLHAIGIGAALAISSRFLAGEIRMPESARKQVENLKDSLESVWEIVENFKHDQPVSWLGVGVRVLEKVLDHRTWDSESEWRIDHGFGVVESRQLRLWNELIWSLPKEIVYRGYRTQVYRIDLPNGSSFVYSGDLQERESLRSGSIGIPEDLVARKKLLAGIREFFWSHRSALILDVVDGDETLSDVDLGATPYLGDSLELIAKLREFHDAGLRRNILFQGRPGTGKSTLCREAARRLSSRTLILTSQYLDNVAASEWKMLLEMLDPEMVIVDDIDRISYNLESKLSLFEEGFCDVPYVLMTSNDLERMPQAMRRPGRIDMIFELDAPEPWVLDEVIQGLAMREGVSVPPEHFDNLRLIAQETSTAHVVEALRRARVQGWGAELNGDITFAEGFCPQKEEQKSDPLPRSLRKYRKSLGL
jgi:adenylate kinase family enzyme